MAALPTLDESSRLPADVRANGYDYFLEVDIATDEAVSGYWAKLSAEQRLDAVIHYAEYDAYPEWLHELGRALDNHQA